MLKSGELVTARRWATRAPRSCPISMTGTLAEEECLPVRLSSVPSADRMAVPTVSLSLWDIAGDAP
jgi:hypothetical protein